MLVVFARVWCGGRERGLILMIVHAFANPSYHVDDDFGGAIVLLELPLVSVCAWCGEGGCFDCFACVAFFAFQTNLLHGM